MQALQQTRVLKRQADDACDGMMAGAFLEKCMGLTKHQIRSAKFSAFGILKNGARIRVNETVRAGDVLEICLDEPARTSAVAARKYECGALQSLILYEDEDVLVCHKPSGMPVHMGRGHYSDSLAALMGCPHVVGRLDKDTSGIVLFAKSRIACERLQRPGCCRKEYAALVQGGEPFDFPLIREAEMSPAQMRDIVWKEDEPGSGWMTIDTPIAEDPARKNHMMCTAAGKRAVTWFQVLQSGAETELLPHFERMARAADLPAGSPTKFNAAAKPAADADALQPVQCSLLRLRLQTGRTHQIRVHMAFAGHAVLCDPVYGKERAEHRLALHCARLSFMHPFRNERICVHDWGSTRGRNG